MLNPMRDKNEGTYRGEGTTPVTTACPEDRSQGKTSNVRVELQSKINRELTKVGKSNANVPGTRDNTPTKQEKKSYEQHQNK